MKNLKLNTVQKIIFILIQFIVVSSCTFKIHEVNNIKYIPNKSYLVAGEKNNLTFSSFWWKIVSTDIGTFEKYKKGLEIEVKDFVFPSKCLIHAKSKIFGIEKKFDIIASRKPTVKLNFYPYDLGDTIHFDNIRFLRFRLESDSTSFEKVSIDSDFFECRFDTIACLIAGNRIFKPDLDRIFKFRPNQLFIDTVHYTYQKVLYKQAVNKTFQIIYPEKDNYSELLDVHTSFHNNSLRAITSVAIAKMYQSKDSIWSETFEIAEYNTRKSKYVYDDRFYMNLGELEGINLIKVKSSSGEILFERLIDGRNLRIEDFLQFYGEKELFIEVRGFFNWDILIRFV